MMAKAAKMAKASKKPKHESSIIKMTKKMTASKTMMSKIRQTVQASSNRLLPPNFSDTIDLGGGGNMRVIARDEGNDDHRRAPRGAQVFDLPGVRKNATQMLADRNLKDARKPKALGNLGEMHKQILVWVC